MKRCVAWAVALACCAGCSSQGAREEVASAEPHAATAAASVDAATTADASTNEVAANVEHDVEALLAEGRLKPLPRSARQGRPLSPGKASSYTTVPLEARFASEGLSADPSTAPQELEVYVFSMGQADAMLVVGPPPLRKTLLIDAGETNWNTRKGCAHVRDRVKAITGQYRVDYLVVSHYHMDHTGYPPTVYGNNKVFEGGGIFCLLGSTPEFFSVGKLIDSGPAAAPFQPEPKLILDTIEASKADWIAAGTLGAREIARFGTSQINLGAGVVVDIVVTDGRVQSNDPGAHAAVEQSNPGTYRPDQQASPNDFSVGMEISLGDFELFTAGDLTGAPGEPPYDAFMVTQHHQVYTNVESPIARAWSASNRESDVEIYRANHHGSANSSTVDLLALLEPELVIYSCGGKYGHPDRVIADRVQAMGGDQILTTEADWPNRVFPAAYGNGWDNPAGEIAIVVPVAGGEFTVSSATQAWSYPIFSDAQEATP
jgi:hypothetical protein